jgi:hypothetical protein
MSSLAWADVDRVASTHARRANIAYTLAATQADLSIDQRTQVPGILNVIWDGLLRGKTGAEVGLDPRLQVYFPANHIIMQSLSLCDPTQPIEMYTEHTELARNLVSLLQSPDFVHPA